MVIKAIDNAPKHFLLFLGLAVPRNTGTPENKNSCGLDDKNIRILENEGKNNECGLDGGFYYCA